MASAGKRAAEMYDGVLDWRKFKIDRYIRNHRVMVCYRDDRPVGVMLSRLYRTLLDPEKTVLFQDFLFAEPGTRAAKLLLDEFVDFGKTHANHVISTIGLKTNIKRSSLEKLGFLKLEERYRMEVS